MNNGDSTSRAKLLDAGMRQLLEDGLKIVQRGLDVKDITSRSRVSEKTYYEVFRNKGRFVDELLSSLNAAPQRAAAGLTEVVQQQLIKTGGDPRKTVRAVCAWDFEQVRQDPSILVQLAVLVLARQHPGAMSRLRHAYAVYDNAGKQAYEVILARWGAALRKPFTHESVAVILTALVEGLSIRHLADPKAVSPALFGETVIALIGSIVDTGQNHEHIDDVVAPLAEEVMGMYERAQADRLPDNPRGAIVDAARREFGTRGYFATTLGHISISAAVPLPVLKQLFPSKALIVVGALRTHVEDIRRQTNDDRALGLPLTDVITRFLKRLASFALNNREFVEALLAVVAHDTAASPETAVQVKRELDLPGIIVPVIEAAQEHGHVAADLSAYDAAAMAVNTLLLRCFTRREHSADEHAEVVMSVLFYGLLTREIT
jgi:AcrR family transcriptional regulator